METSYLLIIKINNVKKMKKWNRVFKSQNNQFLIEIAFIKNSNFLLFDYLFIILFFNFFSYLTIGYDAEVAMLKVFEIIIESY